MDIATAGALVPLTFGGAGSWSRVMKILAPVSSLLLGVAFLLAGHGLQLTLVPLRAGLEGWNAFQIGVIGSSYFVGFVLGCLAGPFMILRAGHIRAFAALVALAATVTIGMAVFVNLPAWIAFRTIMGFSLAGIYMIIESWLNDRATNQTRGFIMSAYIVVNFAAITVGQLTVTLFPPTDFALFAIASMAISLATIPVALTRSAQPAPITLVHFRPRALYRSSPVGIIGVTLIGVANGAFWSLGAVFAIGAGLSTSAAAVFVSVAVVGGALSQWPAGRISDRIDRRVVLVSLLGAAAAIGLVMAFVPVSGVLWFALAFFFGVTTLPTYSIAAAHAYDYAQEGTYVETAAGILLANGLGSVVGPLIAAAMMDRLGTSTLFLFTATVQLALAAFVVTRLRTRATLSSAEKTDFDLAATAVVGGVISPEPLDLDDPEVAAPADPAPADADQDTNAAA